MKNITFSEKSKKVEKESDKEDKEDKIVTISLSEQQKMVKDLTSNFEILYKQTPCNEAYSILVLLKQVKDEITKLEKNNI